jgi:phosphate transport system substrate-binding protein
MHKVSPVRSPFTYAGRRINLPGLACDWLATDRLPERRSAVLRRSKGPSHVKLQRRGTLACLAISAALALTACGSDNNSPSTTSSASGGASPADCAKGTLNAAGSSAQKNAMAEWVKEYQGLCSGVTINYDPSGSGAGITSFGAGTADFAGSDSPMKDTEQAKADTRCTGGKAIHLPMVIGPIAVVYNVSGLTSLQLKSATLAKIFTGKITKWNDPAIAADNSGVTLPSATIQTIHRSDSSGTTDNFTKFLGKTAATDYTLANDKVWKASGGTGAKGSDGVASAVKGADGTIGYVEKSFADSTGLKTAKIGNGAGEYAELTPDSAAKTIAGAIVAGTGGDLKLTIDYKTTQSGAYPIVLVTYEIACTKGLAADKAALVKSFLKYAASTAGQSKLTALGYAPLPSTVQTQVQSSIDTLSAT